MEADHHTKASAAVVEWRKFHMDIQSFVIAEAALIFNALDVWPLKQVKAAAVLKVFDNMLNNGFRDKALRSEEPASIVVNRVVGVIVIAFQRLQDRLSHV